MLTNTDGLYIIVCGGRDFTDVEFIEKTLDGYDDIALLIHGMAPGVDTIADNWTRKKGITVKGMPADWRRHDRAAGPIRNREMLKLDPDLVIAFPGGRGTADMVNQARAAFIDVHEIAYR